MVNPNESGSQFGLQNVCSRRTFLGIGALTSITGGLFVLAGCGPADISSVSAAPATGSSNPPLTGDEASCGKIIQDKTTINARQNDARTLLNKGYSDAEMRARMQEFCSGMIPPQK